MCAERYGWYVMPPTLHKFLEHSSEIVKDFELTIGHYPEECQEVQNKEIRIARLNHTCKISWLNIM